MSRKTLVSLKNLMSEILNDAMEDGLIDVNPAQSKRIVIPSTKVNVREALPIDVFKTILSSLPQLMADDRRLMALMMLTGMRRGEILGLRWEDIRFTDNLILVQRNVTYSNNQPHVGTPKTTNGERVVPLNALLLEFLKPYHEHGYILGNEKPFTEAAYRRSMERIDKHIDLHGATAHIFRHSYLTYIAGTGIDIKTLQAIAGHADVKLTMNRYVHKQTSNIVAAGERIQTLLTT
jgi:integrase